jgi:hypothetical protein
LSQIQARVATNYGDLLFVCLYATIYTLTLQTQKGTSGHNGQHSYKVSLKYRSNMKAIKEMSIVKAFIKAWKNMRFSSADTAKYNCQMFFTDRYFYF